LFRVISLNANGIRAAARKGFYEWMDTQNADIVCIQETKAQEHQLIDECFRPKGYYSYYYDALRKGYSGVAIYSRHKPKKVIRGIGLEGFDDEGRYIEIRLKNINIISVYLPSGSSGDIRQNFKMKCLEAFETHLVNLRRRHSEYIICGDWNIAHHEIDIKNWRGNKKNSGFLPEERAWLTNLFDNHKYKDAFRIINNNEDQYTWWSNRGRAWDKNVGWRIDYQIVTPGLKGKVIKTDIYKAERFSDHAPLTISYDWEI